MIRNICPASFAVSCTSSLAQTEGVVLARGAWELIQLIHVRRAKPASFTRVRLYGRNDHTGDFAERVPLPHSSNFDLNRDMRASSSPSTHLLALTPLDAEPLSDGELSPDSLFDEPQESPPNMKAIRTTASAAPDNVDAASTNAISRRSAPAIPGLFMDPTLLLPNDLVNSVLHACMSSFFADPGEAGINQVMFFGRAGSEGGESTAFPLFLGTLLAATSELLLRHPTLPRETHAMLFPPQHEGVPRARQAIVNLYHPGEGITPHVDLLNRFGDGIVGVSLGSGTSMRFARAQLSRGMLGGEGCEDGTYHEVWLPPQSVLVLTGEARYEWTHGIASRTRNNVEDAVVGEDGWQWQERGVRVSVTFLWLLPGAEIVRGNIDSDGGEDHHQIDVGRENEIA
jgi:2OG-Fe(II) oxygenase superfamily